MRRLLASVSLGVLCLFAGLAGPAAAQNSTVSVRLVDSLSTGSSQRGDTFNATLASPLIWHNSGERWLVQAARRNHSQLGHYAGTFWLHPGPNR